MRHTAVFRKGFDLLPDAGKLEFKEVPAVDLTLRLPNLPPRSDAETASPFDLIDKLIIYPPTGRTKAAEALDHPWFTHGPVVLPEELLRSEGSGTIQVTKLWNSKSLGDWMLSAFKATR